MGRNCGWLTAATASEYRKLMEEMSFVPELGLSSEQVAQLQPILADRAAVQHHR